MRAPVGVIGTGYVGLVTAAGFAHLGSEVFCIDIDADKIARLRAGEIPIYEPGLAEMVASNRGRLHFSTDIADALEHARLLLVAVGTPPTYSGDADLSAVHAVVDAIPASDEHALVMKSTVPAGTGASIKRTLAERGKDGLAYVSCPEFLKEGSAVHDFLHPDRVVVGDDGDWAGDAVVELYAPLDAPLVRTDIASAEMVKLASNAFLATKISFINEIANVCEETGADVIEVARGMGLDDRIGPKFLQAGIGFGGSCLPGDETVLVRLRGRTTLMTFARLWRLLADDGQEERDGVVEPAALEVLSWIPGGAEPQFMPVMCVTRRDYEGDILEVRTKTGRRIRCTPDHPWIVCDGTSAAELVVKPAAALSTSDWLPLAQGAREHADDAALAQPVPGAADAAQVHPSKVMVRLSARRVAGLVAGSGSQSDRRRRDPVIRGQGDNAFGTPRPGAVAPTQLALDDAFWRVVGLYLATGSTTLDGRVARIDWSFRTTGDQHVVDELLAYWWRHDVPARTRLTSTSHDVCVSSREIVTWWSQVVGMARTAGERRLPDLIWDRSEHDKRAMLSALFEAGGASSLHAGEVLKTDGQLADGVLRLLGELGVVAALRAGALSTSTTDGHSRRDDDGPAWLRVVDVARRRFDGPVYSMEVPGTHTFVTSTGLIAHNCFPKDVNALKQLAGNSGYHFQLLNAVIEVNELQKRRVIGKLQKHLGSLVGKTIALLGLAFKPNTDDMREASSLVLSARLQADGAKVRVYDPIAEREARTLIRGVHFATDALDAVTDADAVVLVTEWDELVSLHWPAVAEHMAGTLVLDGRNALDADAVRAAGLTYEGIGRGALTSFD